MFSVLFDMDTDARLKKITLTLYCLILMFIHFKTPMTKSLEFPTLLYISYFGRESNIYNYLFILTFYLDVPSLVYSYSCDMNRLMNIVHYALYLGAREALELSN